MNEDKMLDVEQKIKDIDAAVSKEHKQHDEKISKLKFLRQRYNDVWNGLKAEDDIKRLEKKEE